MHAVEAHGKSHCASNAEFYCCAEDPLFGFLKAKQGGLLTKDIKWNFTKFLVDREGNVIKRCAAFTHSRLGSVHASFHLSLHTGSPAVLVS